MKLLFNFKHYIYSGLREILVYHHNSLEFRAKIFALIIAANNNTKESEFDLVYKAGMEIYDNEDRVTLLVISTREYVQKVHGKNSLNIDDLIDDIVCELNQIPRYVSKIDTKLLYPIVECNTDEDSSMYQIRIIEFLEQLKKEHTQ